ncbi:hypothetical protein ACQP2U_24565 [Nocardia sp. CA-084685]|uniref:hypothetical protein n=1 Tax=Nocardia sp. CA-084685 TaxID=3239970 RepID=UPI003D9676E8
MAISDKVRAALGGDVAIAGQVSADEAPADFCSSGAGLVDRLALAGSDNSQRQVVMVPGETGIRARCLELLRAAEKRVRVTVTLGRIHPRSFDIEALRGRFFARHVHELRAPLTLGEPDRQTLRGALYVYGRIVEHPLLSSGTGRRPRGIAATDRREARLAPIDELLDGRAGIEFAAERRTG